MFTSLDLLVIVFTAIAAITLLSLCIMFLVRNKIARKISFYVATALALYMSGVGIYIGSDMFPIQVLVGITTVFASIAAVVFDLASRKNEKLFLTARVISAVSLIIAVFNAIL